jgi:tetratricopeptide (TPR) repeat protein
MKTIPLILLTAFLAHTVQPVQACGNEYYRTAMPLKAGKLDLKFLLRHSDELTPYWFHGITEGESMQKMALVGKIISKGVSAKKGYALTWPEIEDALRKKIDFKLLSDYAWMELKMGDKQNAVRLLERLYEQHPNEYNVMANLGTAYEVTGNNKKALELLKKAVAANPGSHYGSEWIHIAILEQKLAPRPDYTKIIHLQTGPDLVKWINDKQYRFPRPADSLKLQIAYQLHERIAFIAPPDNIVSQLIRDFANIVAKTQSGKQAEPFYKFSAEYQKVRK